MENIHPSNRQPRFSLKEQRLAFLAGVPDSEAPKAPEPQKPAETAEGIDGIINIEEAQEAINKRVGDVETDQRRRAEDEAAVQKILEDIQAKDLIGATPAAAEKPAEKTPEDEKGVKEEPGSDADQVAREPEKPLEKPVEPTPPPPVETTPGDAAQAPEAPKDATSGDKPQDTLDATKDGEGEKDPDTPKTPEPGTPESAPQEPEEPPKTPDEAIKRSVEKMNEAKSSGEMLAALIEFIMALKDKMEGKTYENPEEKKDAEPQDGEKPETAPGAPADTKESVPMTAVMNEQNPKEKAKQLDGDLAGMKLEERGLERRIADTTQRMNDITSSLIGPKDMDEKGSAELARLQTVLTEANTELQEHQAKTTSLEGQKKQYEDEQKRREDLVSDTWKTETQIRDNDKAQFQSVALEGNGDDLVITLADEFKQTDLPEPIRNLAKVEAGNKVRIEDAPAALWQKEMLAQILGPLAKLERK